MKAPNENSNALSVREAEGLPLGHGIPDDAGIGRQLVRISPI